MPEISLIIDPKSRTKSLSKPVSIYLQCSVGGIVFLVSGEYLFRNKKYPNKLKKWLSGYICKPYLNNNKHKKLNVDQVAMA